jgi:hypothetical protein
MHPAVLALSTVGWREERAPTPGGERVADSLEPYIRSRATELLANQKKEHQEDLDMTTRPDLTGRLRAAPARSRHPAIESVHVSTLSGARPTQAPEADACERTATLPLTQMHRTGGPNERNRPLGGAGEPARSRVPNGQDLGYLSQAQAMTASLTARSAVARENRPLTAHAGAYCIPKPASGGHAAGAGQKWRRTGFGDGWLGLGGNLGHGTVSVRAAGGSSHLPGNTHRQPRASRVGHGPPQWVRKSKVGLHRSGQDA